MAKRKLTSLRTVLLRYLLLCGCGCALILVLWWIIFMQLINIGFLLPAVASAQACSEARETVAACLGCTPREITFTSGGSEADNQALISAARIGERSGKMDNPFFRWFESLVWTEN